MTRPLLAKIDSRLRQTALYVAFGVLTTVVNVVVYALCLDTLGNVPSTVVAWVVSVLFAFVTNRRYVFSAHRDAAHGVLFQLLTFVGFRLASGGLDVGIMWLTVDVMHLHEVLMKVAANVVVVVVNFAVSKFFIFRQSE